MKVALELANKFRVNGTMIRMVRQQLKLSREDLVDKTGLCMNTLVCLENGTTKYPSVVTIAALAEALNLKIDQLVYKVPTV